MHFCFNLLRICGITGIRLDDIHATNPSPMLEMVRNGLKWSCKANLRSVKDNRKNIEALFVIGLGAWGPPSGSGAHV